MVYLRYDLVQGRCRFSLLAATLLSSSSFAF